MTVTQLVKRVTAEKIQKQGGNYLFAVKGHKEWINKAFE